MSIPLRRNGEKSLMILLGYFMQLLKASKSAVTWLQQALGLLEYWPKRKVSKAKKKLDERRTATYKHTRAEIEETWLGLWEREIARFDWLVSIKQSKIMHTPMAEQRKAVDAWIANGRQETPTVDLPGTRCVAVA